MSPEFKKEKKKDVDTSRYVTSVAKTAAENRQPLCQAVSGDHFSFPKM